MINKDENIVIKTFINGFKSINKDLDNCAKSLRAIASNMKNDNTRWHSVDIYGAPGPEYEGYDWVLVLIADDPNIFQHDGCIVYDVPHIAEFRNGKWFSNECKGVYGTYKIPFKVVSWRPIPGDSCEVLYFDEVHKYE